MRPFRLRVVTAIVFAILMLGSLGSVANAGQIQPSCFPEDPWPGLRIPTSFPEDPWPGLWLPTTSFPEDPWPGLGN
jgi:disulfide bond formation protein DsbB